MLLDTTNAKINAADFEPLTDRRLLLIPTFSDNRLVAYMVGEPEDSDQHP